MRHCVWLLLIAVFVWVLAGAAQEVKPLRTLTAHTLWAYSVAFSPDGQLLASGSCGQMSSDHRCIQGEVKLWDVATGSPIRTLAGHTCYVQSVAFSPDGRTLASAGDNTIKLWEVATGREVRTLHYGKLIISVAFSPDGKLLASGSGDNKVILWNAYTGREVRILSGHTDYVASVAFSPDGQLLASGSGDHTIELWDVATGSLVHTLRGHTRDVNSVAFSPNGRLLASGSCDDTVKLWEVETGREVRTLTGYAGWVWSVTFSPDGQLLASAEDNTIKLWEVATGEEILALSGYVSHVMSVAFSPNGRLLATGSCAKEVVTNGVRSCAKGEVKLWTLQVVENQPPQARFIFSPSISDTATYVQFNASSSFDPDGTIKSYKWSFGDGSVAYVLRPTHRFSHVGTFTVTLTVTDDEGATASVSKTITVKEFNEPPIAQFTTYVLGSSGERKVEVQPVLGDRVWFDASESSDPDGNVVKYEWDWESDGSYDASVTDPVIGHVFTTPGTHKATLRVTDDKGGTAKVTKTITVGTKQQPQASFTYLPAAPSIQDTILFSNTSTDPDGSVASWSWDFGDGSISTKQNPTHTYSEKKTYTIKLTVTDNDGLTDTATKKLTVINLAPTAAFTFSPKSPVVGQPTSFDASSSTDKDGTITNYAWDFGDQSTATGATVNHTFTKEGIYAVTLTVTDNDGGTATHEEKITLRALPPPPPKFNDEWGLVVGIQKYQDQWINDHFPVSYTETDAQAFYDFLSDAQGGGFPKDHVRLLLGKDATLIGMRKGLDWLSTVAGTDDLVVFYFAGHGTVVPDKNHDEAKVDPNDTQDECLVSYDADWSSLTATTLVDDAIGYWFSNLTSKDVLMVFDSCFSGGASRGARTFGKGGSRAAAGNEVFTDMAGAGRLFLAASQADQSSYEYSSLGHGVFTYFLLRGLGDKALPNVEALPAITEPEADKDGDGRVTVAELQEYLDEKIPPFVRQHEGGGEQTPVVAGDEGLRNVRLNGYNEVVRGEVSSVAGDKVLVTLGSRQGISVGDELQVVRFYKLADGTMLKEIRAMLQVVEVLGPDRAYCKVIHEDFQIAIHDVVVIAGETQK